MARFVNWSQLVLGSSLALLLLFVWGGGRAMRGWGPAASGMAAAHAGHGGLRGDGSRCATVWCESERMRLRFGIVADLDRQSAVESKAGHAQWRSVFKTATLSKPAGSWQISWDGDSELTTHLGEDGRGLELSELLTWEGRLWTFDDRSGVVFELDKQRQCIPRYVLMEGDGANTKGQKTEWATVKDGSMVVGSFGKPYTNNGVVTSRNNLWVSRIHPSGAVSHEDWTDIYARMQRDTDSVYPGYMIHEAIHFDEVHRLWYVLPRRVSHDAYDEKQDEVMGSNLMLVYNEDFTKLERSVRVGRSVPTHGWSSFKFVPFTGNKVVIALRSLEIEDKDTGAGEQGTFVTVFHVDGEVLIEEQLVPGAHKFEGLEFL